MVLKLSAGLARALSSTSLGEYLGDIVTSPLTTSTSCQHVKLSQAFAQGLWQTCVIPFWDTLRQDMQVGTTWPHLILFIQLIPANMYYLNWTVLSSLLLTTASATGAERFVLAAGAWSTIT